MKYDSLFNVLYSDKEDVVSYNKLTAKPVQKYVYFASKENYKSLNNEYYMKSLILVLIQDKLRVN